MSADFLRTQLRLLIAQFGRRSVLEAFAAATDSTPEQIQDEISKLETARRAKSTKRDKTLTELLAALPSASTRARELLSQLGHMFETKQFLPNLRDTVEFLQRRGGPLRKHKSRKEALGAILKSLSEMSESELESLVSHSAKTGGKSDYAVLADQLMGKKR